MFDLYRTYSNPIIRLSGNSVNKVSEQGSHLLAVEGTLDNALFHCSQYTNRLTQLPR